MDGTDDYVNLPNTAWNFFRTGGTISAWIKPSSVTATQTLPYKCRAIISKGNVYLAFIINESGYPAIYYYDGSVKEVTSTVLVSTSSWQHIMATWDTGSCKIFQNGAEVASSASLSPAKAPAAQATNVCTLGYQAIGGVDYYGGLLDEVALFTSDLSGSIAAIYNGGSPTDLGPDGLNLSPINWWRMGDINGAVGATITDQGSAGDDGTLTNGPSYSSDTP